jgi:hypothetical protein
MVPRHANRASVVSPRPPIDAPTTTDNGLLAAPIIPAAPLLRYVPVPVRRWLPAATVLTVTVGMLLSFGTSPWDILRFAGYIFWGLMLPGTLVYRSLRRTAHSLVDDLAMGTAVGFVLELAAWAVFGALGLQRYLLIWPLLVVAVFAGVPALRRHCRRPAGLTAATVGWSWGVAGVALVMLLWLGQTALDTIPVPLGRPEWYYLDSTYLMSIAAEAKHQFPLHDPNLSSDALYYHYFAYAQMAVSSWISGVDLPVIYFRLALPLFTITSVVLLAVVGWRITRRPWVGVLAAALMFAASEFLPTPYILFGQINRAVVNISPSVPYAWLFSIPLIAVCADRIRRGGLAGGGYGRTGWVLLVLFAAASAGAKATILPIVLAGVALVIGVELVRRRLALAAIAVAVAIMFVLGLSLVVLFDGQSGGLALAPSQALESYVPAAQRSAIREAVLVAVALGGYALYMLARLAGIPVLAWLGWLKAGHRGQPYWSTESWLLLGATAAGVGGSLLLLGPTWSQFYFLRSAFPFAVVLSALGFAALVDRHRIPRRTVGWTVTAALVAGIAIIEVHYRTGIAVPGERIFVLAPIYWVGAITVAVGLIYGLVLLVVRRRWPDVHRGYAVVFTLATVLLMGVPNTGRETLYRATAPETPFEGGYYFELITPDGIATTDWIKENVPVDDVLATNGHCRAGDPNPRGDCTHLTSWLPAYAERRFVLTGWGYGIRSAADAAKVHAWPGTLPFSDTRKLEVNDGAIYAPTRAVLDELRDRYDANWIVVDRTVSPESPELAELIPLRFERGDYAVYELR